MGIEVWIAENTESGKGWNVTMFVDGLAVKDGWGRSYWHAANVGLTFVSEELDKRAPRWQQEAQEAMQTVEQLLDGDSEYLDRPQVYDAVEKAQQCIDRGDKSGLAATLRELCEIVEASEDNLNEPETFYKCIAQASLPLTE